MPGVYKRTTDKARGKAGKWTCWYIGADGKQHSKVGFVDKAKSIELANHLEYEARQVREGIVDPNEKVRREASLRDVGDHVSDYRNSLKAKGDGLTHCRHVANAIKRLLADAAIGSVAEIAPDRIQETIGRMKASGKSARTCNHALNAVKAFVVWLERSNRIKEAPRGLMAIRPYNEKIDRRVIRRAATMAEIDRLLAAAEAGATLVATRPGRGRKPDAWLTGAERAALYRLAIGTGFRANELRSLRPEWFHLDAEPRIAIPGEYTKNRKDAVQPITPELAEGLKPFVASRERGKPLIAVPEKTAKILRHDLEAAGIPYKDDAGRVLDFHALRHSYITHLIASGANPKIVQTLARHSTITLTLDLYTHVESGDIRDALAGLSPKKPASDPPPDPPAIP